MAIFLFRSRDNPIDYCATDSRSGHRLPGLNANSHWHYHAELQNALHAAVFGVMNFEQARQAISRKGYLCYTDNRMLRTAGSLES